jgi:hypothetical protein
MSSVIGVSGMLMLKALSGGVSAAAAAQARPARPGARWASGRASALPAWSEDVLDGDVVPRRAAWYSKPQPTFSDVLATVRYRLWTSAT